MVSLLDSAVVDSLNSGLWQMIWMNDTESTLF